MIVGPEIQARRMLELQEEFIKRKLELRDWYLMEAEFIMGEPQPDPFLVNE